MEKLTRVVLLVAVVGCGADVSSNPGETADDAPAIAAEIRCPNCIFTQTFTRVPGNAYFELARFQADPTAQYIIDIRSGPEGARATVRLNGVELVANSPTKQSIVLHGPVTLRTLNELSVRMAGEPGLTLRIDIERKSGTGGVGGFTQLSAGRHVCGLTADGRAFCWGLNQFGEVGDGTTLNRNSPIAVLGGLRFVEIDASNGNEFTCARTSAGKVYCWGFGLYGQLGTGTSESQPLPTPVLGNITFTSVSVGITHACGLVATGAAYCWGHNAFGAIGDGTTTDRSQPTAVTGVPAFASISAGEDHTCGRAVTGEVWCWGWGMFGELGDGATSGYGAFRVTPAPVAGNLAFTSLAAPGSRFVCGIAAGLAYCWGYNLQGTTGSGLPASEVLAPVPVAAPVPFVTVTTGLNHACALTAVGQAYCWGQNVDRQIGDGSSVAFQTTPVPSAGALRFTQLSAGAFGSCGIATDGYTYCWGRNSEGQLGNGTGSGFGPVRVLFP